MKKWIPVIIVSGLTLAQRASALTGQLPLPKPDNLPGNQNDNITTLGLYYINVFLSLVGLVTVTFIIYGGFRYITSAGNEEAAESGRKILSNAIIGLVIVILSYVIVAVVSNALYGRTGA